MSDKTGLPALEAGLAGGYGGSGPPVFELEEPAFDIVEGFIQKLCGNVKIDGGGYESLTLVKTRSLSTWAFWHFIHSFIDNSHRGNIFPYIVITCDSDSDSVTVTV